MHKLPDISGAHNTKPGASAGMTGIRSSQPKHTPSVEVCQQGPRRAAGCMEGACMIDFEIDLTLGVPHQVFCRGWQAGNWTQTGAETYWLPPVRGSSLSSGYL